MSPASAKSARRHDAISRSEARTIAVAAQGFHDARLGRDIEASDIRGLVERLGLLQLDSVNVFCRSHYMPVFARPGPYDRSILDRMAAHTGEGADRELIEYWGHEASLMTPQTYRLLHWRTGRADLEAWKPLVKLAREQPQTVQETLQLVADQGPIRASATGDKRPPRRRGEMWNWHQGKMALEYLFYSGRVAAAGRVNFERLYDLPERVLPAEVLGKPSLAEPDAQRELTRIAARALGVASESDLGDYFRLTRADSKQRVAELVESRELETVDVEGWTTPAYVRPDVTGASRATDGAGGRRRAIRALLSPFDSLIWTRDRTERIFDFTYHVEIYTPAAKREYGYYVLPFLLGDALVARVDLKSDRQTRALMVRGAFAEAGVDASQVARELAAELLAVARWLDLSDVEVAAHGDLAPALSEALA
jgi:uncharacterized protein